MVDEDAVSLNKHLKTRIETGTMAFTKLTDQQWAFIVHFLPPHFFLPRVGRPHADYRTVFNSIFYLNDSGCKWENIPKTEDYAPKSVAHRYAQKWESDGLLKRITDAMLAAAHLQKKMRPGTLERRWNLC